MEKLLESFTADLGITPQQLANACSQSNTLGEAHQVYNVMINIIIITMLNIANNNDTVILRLRFVCPRNQILSFL